MSRSLKKSGYFMSRWMGLMRKDSRPSPWHASHVDVCVARKALSRGAAPRQLLSVASPCS